MFLKEKFKAVISIVLSIPLNICWLGDSAAAYQLGFQDPATTTMEGILTFNFHLLFV